MSRVRVLIGGNDDWHDVLGAGQRLRDLLSADGHAATLHLGAGAQQVGGPDTNALVMYTNGLRMHPDDQTALADRVQAGLGLVALHSSCVDVGAPEEHETWFGLIGCRFAHHPPFGRFTVSCAGAHPVTAGIDRFEIDDELYLTKPAGEPMTVLATADHEGRPQPMVSVRETGKGRVCFIAPGHDARAWANPGFQRLVQQAVRWTAR